MLGEKEKNRTLQLLFLCSGGPQDGVAECVGNLLFIVL